jgi:hypothetical protein
MPKATSQKQRGFVFARFGSAWAHRHHFANKGKLKRYAHGNRSTSPAIARKFRSRKR